MSLQTNLTSLVQRIGSEFKDVRVLISGSSTGDVSGLSTSATDLVSAINEVSSDLSTQVGDINTLGTTATDLVGAINEVQGEVFLVSGLAVTSVNGISGPGAITIDTSSIEENGNLFFTEPRVLATKIAGISTATAGALTSEDSVLLALGKLAANINLVSSDVATLSTDDVAEGSSLYFTEARVIASPLTDYLAGAGTISSADSVISAIQKLDGNIQELSTDEVSEGSNLYYTDARADARIANAIGSTAAPSAGELASTQDTVDYVSGRINALINGAGAAYDTLQELAAEIQNNDSDIGTLLNGSVRFDVAQTLSSAQQDQAAGNLGLGAGIANYDFVADFNAELAS